MEYNFKFEYPKKTNPDGLPKFPVGLLILCIVTIVGNIFYLLAYLLFFFTYHSLPDMMAMVSATMGSSLAKYYAEMAEMFHNTPQYFFLLMTIPCLLSIAGSGCMIKMRKIGFHLYVVGQILLLGLPILIQKQNFSFFDLLVSIIFIALYSSYLRRMK
jgi:hypothetical protein